MKAENLTLDMFKGYAYLYIEGYLVQDHDLILRAMQLAKEAGAQICLDMASYNIVAEELDFFTTLINKYVDIVLPMKKKRVLTQEKMHGKLSMKFLPCAVWWL